MKNDLQALFLQVDLALRNSKSKLDSLDTIAERVEELEESQHRLISSLQEKLNESAKFTLWNVASVGIPLSILAWYSYSAYCAWKSGKLPNK